MGSIDDYRMLDLEPDESLERIRQAYRDMAFIWHPDRIQNNPRLKEKAEGKIKDINAAYQRLRFHQALLKRSQPPEPIRTPTEYFARTYHSPNQRQDQHCVWLD